MSPVPAEREQLTREFEKHRAHLYSVAYRMLGSGAEADDAVQETWLRADTAGAEGIRSLRGWLTTIAGRVCIDMLRTRKSRREEPADVALGESFYEPAESSTPEDDAVVAESVGLALLVVLDTLTPGERLAFVLHDMFDLPFSSIGPIVGRTPNAAAQLASRARRRVRGQTAASNAPIAAQRHAVDAFLAAARTGDLEGLIAVLHDDVALRVDGTAAAPYGPGTVRGPAAVARGSTVFAKYARYAELAIIDGAVGIVVAPAGRLRHILAFDYADGKIAEIDIYADPDRLDTATIAVLDPAAVHT